MAQKQIAIYDLPEKTVYCLDEIALQKGISRNTLIKQIFESYISNVGFSDYEIKYQELLAKSLKVIRQNSYLMSRIVELSEVAYED